MNNQPVISLLPRLIWSVSKRAFRTADSVQLSDRSPFRDQIHECRIRGIDVLRDPKFNQGLAFSLRERQTMGIHGLLPPRVMTQEEQVRRFILNFRRCSNDLERFMHTMSLFDRNERLFFRVITEYIKDMMPIIYTPTVGLACQKYGLIFERPRGLYITINDAGHVYDVISNWPERDVHAIVVTDGERILGLGDLGACGMGIPVGKLALYTAIAGIKPHKCLPVCLDVGTNNPTLLHDRLYLGLRQPRDPSQKYVKFVDEFMEACVRRWGPDVLIQFEDFGQDNAFLFLDRYRKKYLTFNDDIQGTAAVAVAGLLASMRITKKRLSENTFVFMGAGQAATGIATLLAQEMVAKDGITPEQAAEKIFLMDIDGLVVKNRPGNTNYKTALQQFVKDQAPVNRLIDLIKLVKPTALIGASAVRNAFDEEVLRHMAEINDRPCIFALSNPTSRAECTAEAAYRCTDGRAVFASGSPFNPVEMPDGRVFYPGQGNNAYIFPAIALVATVVKAKYLPDSVFLKVCEMLANEVSQEDLDRGMVYPPLEDIREVSIHIATRLAEFMYRENLATYYPEPVNKETFIRGRQYRCEYDNLMPSYYEYPEEVRPADLTS